MKKLTILLILTVTFLLFLSGCNIAGGDPSSIVKKIPQVKGYLKEHPNAEMTSSVD